MNAKRPRHPHSSPRRTAAGFSLIEVIVALTVFAIGVLGLAVMIPFGSNRVRQAGTQTRASTLASQRAEVLLTTPYADGSLTAGTHTDTANPLLGGYYVRWTVTDNTPITSCKSISIEVSRLSTFTVDQSVLTVIKPAAAG